MRYRRNGQLECDLFRPSGRGIALTNRGMLLYQRAKEFLNQEERLFDVEKNSPASTLSIGTVEIFLSDFNEQLKIDP